VRREREGGGERRKQERQGGGTVREREGERGRGREEKVRDRDRRGDTAERRAKEIMWAQIANACNPLLVLWMLFKTCFGADRGIIS